MFHCVFLSAFIRVNLRPTILSLPLEINRSRRETVRRREIDYHLSPCVPFSQITDSLARFAQAVAPVDHRRYLSRLHERADEGQIFLVQFRDKADERLAYKG